MKLNEVRKILDAKLAWGEKSPDCIHREVRYCRASDLMSDVLHAGGTDALLLTGLTNAQVVRTAELAGIAAVCFVRGKSPEPQTIRLAEEQGIPLLLTELTMFESCGRLHGMGLPGG